jgi:lipopolysaccharide export system permease protein
VATLAMLFLAVPLVIGNGRSMSIGQRIFVGAVIGAAFFLLNRALSYMAVVYGIPPALTAFLPALVLAAVTSALLHRVR